MLAAASLTGCGGKQDPAEGVKAVPTGSIPGDAVIPVIKKLGLPDKCRQIRTFDNDCTGPIDAEYGEGAGEDASENVSGLWQLRRPQQHAG